jgi:hypothetical protein
MAGHSRSKNGVASLAYVPAIHVLLAESVKEKTWMPAFAGMTVGRYAADPAAARAGAKNRARSFTGTGRL